MTPEQMQAMQQAMKVRASAPAFPFPSLPLARPSLLGRLPEPRLLLGAAGS